MALFAAGLTVTALAGALQQAPGYMDADYYYATARGLASGKGFHQDFVWNYLDQPADLLQPSHTYWMPLVSLLSAAGLYLGSGWWAARVPLWLVAALAAPCAALCAGKLGGSQRQMRLAGVFALLPGFYLAYFPTTDAFGLYMVLGGLALAAASGEDHPRRRLFAYGVIAGLLHLTRADGIVWLAGGLLLAAWRGWKRKVGLRTALLFLLLVGAGYLLPMAAWYGRNWIVWGSFFPPGNSHTLWLTRYEDTFLYPASLLTPQRWLAAGWDVHLLARWNALTTNLQTLLAVQGQIVLLPFAMIGLWSKRRESLVLFGALMWLVTFGLMTVVFPFAGTNGSFFHSGAAFQPLIWAGAALGIEPVAGWYARKRRLETSQRIERFVTVLLVAVTALMSLGLYVNRMAGDPKIQAGWNQSGAAYREIEAELVHLGAQAGERVMVNNPPGYYLVSERPGVVIPYGDIEMVKAAALQYRVRFLVLELSNSAHLEELYLNPADQPGMRYLTTLGSAKIYEFTN